MSVSIVSNSIEEELKTELELSRFAMSKYEDDAVTRSSLLLEMMFCSHQDFGCFEASLYNQSCRLPSLLLCTLGLPPLSVRPTQFVWNDSYGDNVSHAVVFSQCKSCDLPYFSSLTTQSRHVLVRGGTVLSIPHLSDMIFRHLQRRHVKSWSERHRPLLQLSTCDA